MGLRRVPPSSEKMSHRRHRRSEAKYAPIRRACKVIAMIFASIKGNIRSTTVTCNLTRIYIYCDPSNCQSKWNENMTLMASESLVINDCTGFMILDHNRSVNQ